MKKIAALPFLMIFFAGCESPPPPTPVQPVVKIPKGVEASNLVETRPALIEPATPPPPRAENPFNDLDVQVRPYVDALPPGAIAKCRDGSYSFSRSRSGACSNHGGVDIWYDDERKKDPKSPPPGAIAECRDGTYSYARTTQNACADHNGVATWFR